MFLNMFVFFGFIFGSLLLEGARFTVLDGDGGRVPAPDRSLLKQCWFMCKFVVGFLNTILNLFDTGFIFATKELKRISVILSKKACCFCVLWCILNSFNTGLFLEATAKKQTSR